MSILTVPSSDLTDEISVSRADVLRMGKDLDWLERLLGKVPRGTNLLLAGDPGAGKSTLAQQLCISAAKAGEKPVIITTEQSAELIGRRLRQLAPGKELAREKLLQAIKVVDDLADLSVLPAFLSRQVHGIGGRLAGTSLIVIDSLQGRASPAGERSLYKAIYEVMRMATATGITIVYLAHFTKGRQIAGPRTLEHQADLSAVLRHGINCRSLTVPKNRNGASRPDPYSVIVDEVTTRLVPSPLAGHASTKVATMGAAGPAYIEVAVILPRSDQGFIKGLARKETETIIDLVARIIPSARMLPSLGVTVRAADSVRYSRDFSLAVALGVVCAVNRMDVPAHIIPVGDLDLKGNILPPSTGSVNALMDSQLAGDVSQDSVVIAAPGAHVNALEERGIRVQTATSLQSLLEGGLVS